MAKNHKKSEHKRTIGERGILTEMLQTTVHMAYNIKGIPCANCIPSRIEMSFNSFRFPIHLVILELKVGQDLSLSIRILLALFYSISPKLCLRVYELKAIVLTLLSSKNALIIRSLKVVFILLLQIVRPALTTILF